MIEKDTFVDFFKDETWLQGLAYQDGITEQLNKFNLKLAGPDTNILQFEDTLRGLIEKKNIIGIAESTRKSLLFL